MCVPALLCPPSSLFIYYSPDLSLCDLLLSWTIPLLVLSQALLPVPLVLQSLGLLFCPLLDLFSLAFHSCDTHVSIWLLQLGKIECLCCACFTYVAFLSSTPQPSSSEVCYCLNSMFDLFEGNFQELVRSSTLTSSCILLRWSHASD